MIVHVNTYCLWIRERSESIIFLLSSGIPESQTNSLTIYHYIGRVVVKPESKYSIPQNHRITKTLSNFKSMSPVKWWILCSRAQTMKNES